MMTVLINPVAGAGHAKRVGQATLETLAASNIPHEVVYTHAPGEATTIARTAAENGTETVWVIGGDGTVMEAAAGVVGTHTSLAILPAGTGNDLAKTLQIPKATDAAIAFALSTPPRQMDAMRMDDRLSLNVSGTGFDVTVLEYTLKAKKYARGMLPYLYGVLCAIVTNRPKPMTLWVDEDAPITAPYLIAAVGNGRYFGGGLLIAPTADPSDGLLDLVTVDAMSRPKLLLALPKLVMGRVAQIPGFKTRRVRTVRMEAKGRIQIDGEILPVTSGTLSVQPNALWVRY